ncbi:hypothetical protein Vretimale_520 [Volvox reticuliferus]|uniref:Uncharacterized protein n=1 Tax=Volvox reticuliferus TaxID=1737510 RepID=A0A8J4D3I4_9CHLO|nr:hypothetical protein Vretifemale_2504 [Volvox reticuliferus]GIL94283.1 hypothetical protein Vretimale_520 [Volvox reticuliferus]
MKENVRRRSKQQLGAEALAELKEGRVAPSRPEWSDRRRLGFWQPFNEWWRNELDRLGRRPSKEEIGRWYELHAYDLWKEDAPSLEETRVHAKCLRSIPLVRDYFRNYRARKRAIGARVGASRQRRRGLTDSKLSQDPTASVEDYDYEGEEGEEEGDEGEEGQDDDDMNSCRDLDQHQHDPMDADPDGRYAMGLGLDIDGYLGRDSATAAAAAAASLAQLATLRGHGGSSAATAASAAVGGLPLELLNPGVPAVQSLLGPSAAAALWSAAQQATVVDAVHQGDLLSGLTLQQLQQAALQQQLQQHAQQQLALAAIAQNMALSRVAGISGLTGFPRRTAATAALMQPHGGLVSAMDADDRHLYHEGQYRRRNDEDVASGVPTGHMEDDDEQDEQGDGPGTVDFMEQVAQQAASLGRGKRKRGPGLLGRRHEFEVDALQGEREVADKDDDGTDTETQAGPSGRSSSSRGGMGRGGGRRGGTQQYPARQRRGSKGLGVSGAAVKKQSMSKRQPPRAGLTSPEAAGEADEGREGDREERGTDLALMPLEMLQVPLALSLDPVPRESLLQLTHEELVERVLLLQAHVQLLAQQRQQLEQQLQQQRTGTQPSPAPECCSPPLPLREQQQQQKEEQQQEEPQNALPPQLKQEETKQQQITKQGQQFTSIPTPPRSDSSPANAGPTNAVSGRGCNLTEMQRSGLPVLHGDIGDHVTEMRPQQPRTIGQHPALQQLGRKREELAHLEPAEVAAISVLTGVDLGLATPAGVPALTKAGGGPGCAMDMDVDFNAGPRQPRSDGDSGLQKLIQALPQVAEA